MEFIDVFNGDADGLTSLYQWRKEFKVDSTLVTGVKRDIQLLSRVTPKKSQTVTVFDISLKSNLSRLKNFFQTGTQIVWFDHHQRGECQENENITLHIDENPNTCTSNIVNTVVQGKYKKWASVGAFGDNAKALGAKLASEAGAEEDETESLERLGTLLNYNSYGESLDDLHYPPLDIYREMVTFAEPLSFFQNSPLVKNLETGYKDDAIKAETATSEDFSERAAIYFLPDERWARRIVGTFANSLSLKFRGRAHAVLLKMGKGWQVSVRAPKENPSGADTLCSAFNTGGGRGAAAGINFLPDIDGSSFADRFKKSFC
ncbi:MAG: DHH family phosphoesterase [Nitrospinota bacterium]